MEALLNWFETSSNVWVPILLTALAGVFLKYVDRWITTAKSRVENEINEKSTLAEQAASLTEWNNALREELRREIKTLKEEMAQIESALDEWKSRYYKLLEEFVNLKAVADKIAEAVSDENRNV